MPRSPKYDHRHNLWSESCEDLDPCSVKTMVRDTGNSIRGRNFRAGGLCAVRADLGVPRRPRLFWTYAGMVTKAGERLKYEPPA